MKRKNPTITFLTEKLEFPPVEFADSRGLLAFGGDLSPERLILAYRNGIFPWFNEDSPILWWSPDPRMVLYPKQIRISRSMQKVLRQNRFRLTKNEAFHEVLESCASICRKGQEGTWITQKMKTAYTELFKRGMVHSYEVWEQEELVGGLYGVDLGHIFCGESMFSSVSNASKFALIRLAEELDALNYEFIDCQLYTKHLHSLGAVEIPREEFLKVLKRKDKAGE